MDKASIEEHKAMMISECMPLFEDSGISPDRISFDFDIKDLGDSAIIEMTTFRDGEEVIKRTSRVEQLNG